MQKTEAPILQTCDIFVACLIGIDFQKGFQNHHLIDQNKAANTVQNSRTRTACIYEGKLKEAQRGLT